MKRVSGDEYYTAVYRPARDDIFATWAKEMQKRKEEVAMADAFLALCLDFFAAKKVQRFLLWRVPAVLGQSASVSENPNQKHTTPIIKAQNQGTDQTKKQKASRLSRSRSCEMNHRLVEQKDETDAAMPVTLSYLFPASHSNPGLCSVMLFGN